jgi:hypothetical protein
MAEKETLSYLESELASQIKSHDSSREFYRSANFYICLMTAVFSGATTVLIGIGQALNGDKIFAILSLIFSGAVTVVAAYDGFLRSKDLWIQNTDTWVGLITLRAHLKYEKAKEGSLTQKNIDEFYSDFQRILAGNISGGRV